MQDNCSDEKIANFILDCTEKYGINMAVCENSKDLYFAELRQSCESNTCGNYKKCHTCPPYVGTAKECIEKALSYGRIIVFQKIYQIEDSFDYYGMIDAKKSFKNDLMNISDISRKTFDNPFILGAGGCMVCEKCAAADNMPCRFPKKAMASLEAYCIQVSKLASHAGMKYINGQNTITYFGGVFLK